MKLNANGDLTGERIRTEAGPASYAGMDLYGTLVPEAQLAGWEFEVVSNDDQLLTLRVYKCNTDLLGTDVVVPSVVQDERNSLFFVTHSGGANYADAVYKNATSVTFSEGMTVLEYSCFRQCPNLKSIHFPATFAMLGENGWLGNMMFENSVTRSLAKITVDPYNQKFKTNTEANDLATNTRINAKTGGKNKIGSKVDLKTYPNTQLLSKDGKILFLCATNYLDGSGNPQPMRMIRIADGVETLAQPENGGTWNNEGVKTVLGCNQFVFGPNVKKGTTGYSSDKAGMQNRIANASCEMFFPSTYIGVDVREEVVDENDNSINGYYIGQNLLGKRCHESQTGYITGYYVDTENPLIYSKDGIVYMDAKENGITYKILLRYPSIKSYPYSTDGTTYDSPMVGLEGVNMIFDDACNACYMTHVTVPNTDWFIGYKAFTYCSYLKQVDIPESVNHIRQAAFSSCNSLENIFVDTRNEWYTNCFHNANKKADGVLYKLEDGKHTMLMCYPSNKVPEGNTKTNPYKLCDDVKYVANMAFSTSRHLAYIDLNNAERLNYRAFYSCSELREIVLDKKVEKVGTACFQLCRKLEKVFVGKQVKVLSSLAFSNIGNDNANPTIVEFEENETEGLFIPGVLFSSANVKELNFPQRITEVDERIGEASKLEKVTFADNSRLTALKNMAFQGASQLKEVNFGKQTNLKTIGNSCFINLTNLSKVSEIPASVTSIGKDAFSGCTSLETVTFEKNSKIKKIGNNAFQSTGLKTITLPDHLETLQNEVFAHCDQLKEMIIPDATKCIGHQIGLFCSNLESITVGRGNEVYATSDGMLCSKNKKILLCFPAGKARNSFTLISPSIQVINDSAFYACEKLTNIVIPKKVHTIKNYAFYLCNNLNTITFLGDAPINTEIDAAKDNQNPDANFKDHRFGDRNASSQDFMKNKLTFYIRKNGNEGKYDLNTSYWKNRKKTLYSFHVNNRFNDNGGSVHEYFPTSDNEAILLKSNSDCYTDVIPAKVKDAAGVAGTAGKEYSVRMVSDYAYEDVKPCVKEVVFLGPVDYVGANAFNDGHKTIEVLVPDTKGKYDGFVHNSEINVKSDIQNIFFASHEQADIELATYRFGLNSTDFGKLIGAEENKIYMEHMADVMFGESISTDNYGEWYTDNYPEFTETQHIYVPKSKVKNYVKNWMPFGELINYQIPGISVSNTFGSFSREFDVELSDDEGDIFNYKDEVVDLKMGRDIINWDETEKKPKVLAYVTRLYNIEEDKNVVALKVESINCKKNREDNFDGDGDGTFIPRNTGVLLHAINGTSPSGFYYRIAEPRPDNFFADRKETTGNIMQFVTEKDETISPQDNYIISGGGYKYLTQDKLIPVHKSYLHVAGIDNTSVKGAKTIKLIFDDDEEDTTAIDKVGNEDSASKIKVYDLSGRRLNSISKAGMYIINGQKTFIK